jgi:methyltransferase (TIGR00027 family)
MSSTTANPAAQTALGTMVLAAVEQQEAAERRLVDDDLAPQFLPAAQRALVRATRWAPVRRLWIAAVERSGPGLWANLTCRKRFIDDKLDESLADMQAVVILGAGLDTRPYRLAHRSEIPVYEVDLPVNIDRKAAVVRRALGGPPATVHLVPVDFERDDLSAALAAHQYRSAIRTFFIWEGVTQYLTADAVAATFEYLGHAAPSSRLVFTYVRRDFIDGVNLYGAAPLYRRFRQKRHVWHFGMQPEEVPDFLAQYGWRVIEQAGPDYLVQHYVVPTGRSLGASEIEWSVYAERATE